MQNLLKLWNKEDFRILKKNLGLLHQSALILKKKNKSAVQKILKIECVLLNLKSNLEKSNKSAAQKFLKKEHKEPISRAISSKRSRVLPKNSIWTTKHRRKSFQKRLKKF